jgi:hypothetical protein
VVDRRARRGFPAAAALDRRPGGRRRPGGQAWAVAWRDRSRGVTEVKVFY